MGDYKRDKERLQKYLPYLRGCAGLSAEALANKVGLTKQAISYIETHLDKPMTKMQYICIRGVFDEEFINNPENINLRDCYDLIFSDPDFFYDNIDKVEYALNQAVEDTKLQKKRLRYDQRKNNSDKSKSSKTKFMMGATAATIGIGGIAALFFPFAFPGAATAAALSAVVAHPAGAAAAAATASAIASIDTVKNKVKGNQNKSNKLELERASNNITHSGWLSEAHNAEED